MPVQRAPAVTLPAQCEAVEARIEPVRRASVGTRGFSPGRPTLLKTSSAVSVGPFACWPDGRAPGAFLWRGSDNPRRSEGPCWERKGRVCFGDGFVSFSKDGDVLFFLERWAGRTRACMQESRELMSTGAGARGDTWKPVGKSQVAPNTVNLDDSKLPKWEHGCQGKWRLD